MFEKDGKVPVDINYLRSQFRRHEFFLQSCYKAKRTQLQRTLELATSKEVNILIIIFYVEFHGAIPIKAGKIKNLFTRTLMELWKKNFSTPANFAEFQLSSIQEKKEFIFKSIKLINVCLSPLFETTNGSA